MNGNTGSVTVNCGGTDSYRDGCVGMDSGDNIKYALGSSSEW